jgi:hypothetical protein
MRRKHKRIPLKGDTIRVETVTETPAEIADLGMDGIGIKTSKRLMPGSRCMVAIGSNGSLMIVRGISVWERFAGWSISPRGHVDPLFSAGIRLEESRWDIMTKACGGDCNKTRAVRVSARALTALLSFTESLTLLNLSYGGLLAESWNPMESGTECSARLFLPDRSEPVKCMAKVTSCKTVKHETEKKYHIGFEFLDLDREQTERIKTFIRIRSAI